MYGNNGLSSDFVRGVKEGLRLYGSACSQNECSECPLGGVVGAGNCNEVMRDFPEKAAEALIPLLQKPLSYYNVYCMRFPKTDMGVEDLSESVCRKIIFDGDDSCEGGDCEACWRETYTEE